MLGLTRRDGPYKHPWRRVHDIANMGQRIGGGMCHGRCDGTCDRVHDGIGGATIQFITGCDMLQGLMQRDGPYKHPWVTRRHPRRRCCVTGHTRRVHDGSSDCHTTGHSSMRGQPPPTWVKELQEGRATGQGTTTGQYLDARVCLQVFVLHDMCLCQLKTVCLVWLNSVSAVTNVEFSKVTFNLRVSLPTWLNALNSLMLWPEKQTFCYGAERRNAKRSAVLPAKNHRHQKILPLKLI